MALADESVALLLLLHGAKVDDTDAHGNTVLHAAASHGRLAAAELLLELEASACVPNALGITPLWMACENGEWIEQEEALKAECAKLHAKSNEMMVARKYEEAETALLAANAIEIQADKQRDLVATAELLLASGADVNAEGDATGCAPLIVAAMSAQEAQRAYLEVYPAPPPDPRAKFRTAAENAALAAEKPNAFFGHRVVVQQQLILALLKAGANHQVTNKAGRTAESCCREIPDIQKLLAGRFKAEEVLLHAASNLTACFLRVRRGTMAPV